METIDPTGISESWQKLTSQAIPTGWYDVITTDGVELHEVYYEDGRFRFFGSNTEDLSVSRIEWIRIHSKS